MLFIVVSVCIISLYAGLFSQMVLQKRLEKQLNRRIDELKIHQLDILVELRETQAAIEQVIEASEN